jgi:hypothetical protein
LKEGEMKANIRFMLGSTLVTIMLAACNSAQTVAPVATALPQATSTTAAVNTAAPAATPEAQSTTAEAPAAPGGETLSTTDIGAALTKYAAISSYRVEMEMKGQGALGLSTDENNPNSAEMSLFTLNGDFKGADGHYTLKGFFSSLLGADAEAGVEAMIAGGKYYVKGPINLLGAKENKWYVLQDAQSEAVVPPFQVSDFFSSLSNSDAEFNNFKAAGTETVDGKACNIFSADKTEAVKALAALNAGSMPAAADVTTIENATAKFSICDDGLIHRVEMSMDSSSSEDTSVKASFKINIHIYDYNADITITAPTDAATLDTSSFMEGDATPTN